MNPKPKPRTEWSGDMLDSPEMVDAFATQLRQVLSAQADYVARIRRDAEAMWKANRPDGYKSFEAWWRHRWVTSPFSGIQDHIEAAAKLTFQLEARHRKGRHELPAKKQAAIEAKAQAKDTKAIPASGKGKAPAPASEEAADTRGGSPDFLSIVHRRESA